MSLIMLVSTIFCLLGILVFIFSGSTIFLIIGAILNILEQVLGRLSGELKSLITLFFAIFIGLIISLFVEIPMFTCILFCICLEDVINLIGGSLLVYKINTTIDKSNNMNELNIQKNGLTRMTIDDYNKIQNNDDKLNFFYNRLVEITNIVFEIRVLISKKNIYDNDFLSQYDIKLKDLSYYLMFVNKMFDDISNNNLTYSTDEKNAINYIIDDIKALVRLYNDGRNLIEQYLRAVGTNPNISHSLSDCSDLIVIVTERLSKHLNLLDDILEK